MSTVTENLEARFSIDDTAFGRGINRMLGSLSQLGQRSDQVGDRQERAFGRATTAVGRFVDSSGRLREANGRFANSSNSIGGSLLKITGGFFAADRALALLKQGLEITSDFQRLDAGLEAVSSSSMDFAQTQTFLRGLSDDLGVSYSVLASSYKGLKAATNGTVLEGRETQKIFTAVVHAGAALKLSNDDIQGSLLALTQMMSKGTVSAEELRGQLGERLPGAFKLMAEGLGVTEIELNKMLQTGEVMAVDALPKLAEQLEKTYGAKAQANVESMAGGFTRAKDQLFLFISEFAQTNGIDTFFAKLGNKTADYLKLIRQAQQETGSLFGTIKTFTPAFQKDITTFKGFSSGQKESFLGKLGKNISGKEAELNNVTGLAPTEENLNRERILGAEIKEMKERYAIYRRTLRDENNKTAEEAQSLGKRNAKALDPIAALEKAKDRFKYLTDLKSGLSLQGKGLDKAQASELADLTRKLEQAGVKKTSSKSENSSTVLDTVELAKKLIDDEIQQKRSLGLNVPQELYHELDLVEAQIKRIKGEVEKPIDLKSTGKNFFSENVKSESERYERLSPATVLNSRIGEVKQYGSLQFFTDQLDKIKARIDKFSLQRLAVPQSVMDTLADYIGEINRINRVSSEKEGLAQIRADNLAGGTMPDVVSVQKMLGQVRSAKDAINIGVQELAVAMTNGKQALAQSGVGLLESLGNAIGQGENPLKAALKSILSILGDYLIQLGTALLLSSAALLAAAPLSFGITLAPGLGQQVAGGLLIVGGAAVKAIKMAKGGTLTGRTTIEAGEYAGASSRPEFVSPVDVGARLIAENMAKMGIGGGGGGGTVVFEIAGNKLRGVLQRDQYSQQTYE